MMSSLLKANRIGHAFDGDDQKHLSVLNNISFDLKSGEILCILGTSGCGKTTLLNILTGLLESSTGQVETTINRPGSDIGYMTQDNLLLPWRTVIENVGLGLEFHHFSKEEIQERSKKYLDMVRLSDFSEVYPNTLSGGMRQRVALARTLALEPKLLLMDEPLSNLDVSERQRLAKIIKQYVREKKAGGIIVTHSVEEAVFLADKIILLTPRPANIAQSFKKEDISFDAVMNAFFCILPKEKDYAG